MRNSKKRWIRVLPNMVCILLVFIMLYTVSVTIGSGSGATMPDAQTAQTAVAMPELGGLDGVLSDSGEDEAIFAASGDGLENNTVMSNEQLSHSALMGFDSGFYRYTYCYYTDGRHDIELSEELQLHTFRMAQEYDVQYEMVMAIMGVESGWDENDRGNGVFVGLGMIYIAQVGELGQIGITYLYDPKQNIEAICYYLRYKLDLVGGNEHMALMCYNMGDAGAAAYFDEGVYQTAYSRKVIAFRDSMIKIKMGI